MAHRKNKSPPPLFFQWCEESCEGCALHRSRHDMLWAKPVPCSLTEESAQAVAPTRIWHDRDRPTPRGGRRLVEIGRVQLDAAVSASLSSIYRLATCSQSSLPPRSPSSSKCSTFPAMNCSASWPCSRSIQSAMAQISCSRLLVMQATNPVPDRRRSNVGRAGSRTRSARLACDRPVQPPEHHGSRRPLQIRASPSETS